jgi:hypothetical protein
MAVSLSLHEARVAEIKSRGDHRKRNAIVTPREGKARKGRVQADTDERHSFEQRLRKGDGG